MLYPKNQEKTLSDALFENPTSEYRGTPFWAWNGKLEQGELLEQLDMLKKMGMGGAHMHIRTGMDVPYLSDEHMELTKACIEKCRQEGMLPWLYDEDRWPSGFAGGLVTKDPQYREKFLRFTVDLEPEADNVWPLCCFDIVLDEQGCLASYDMIDFDAPVKGTKWYVYVQSPDPSPWYNDQTYVNTLSKAAIRRFLDITYERYREVVGKDFGGLIPAIFTDEPQFTRKRTLGFATDTQDVVLPWSEDVPQTFRESCGLELIPNLPQLLWELPKGEISVIRYHFHDHICDRFVEAFMDQCGDWCEKNGILQTGHVMSESNLHSQTCALGEAMRCYRKFQLPGIDMLTNNIELTTAKQAQSASRQYGREGVTSELYGVTGWNFDFRGHKFQGDWQAAMGVTVRVHHLSWYTMKGEAKRDYPAPISYQSPWWQDYRYVEDHFARVNTALTRGKPLVRVGVIHPVESYWLHFGPSQQTLAIRNKMILQFKAITSCLVSGCVDYDYISESLLPEQCPKGGAPLQVGHMAYDTIIVPGCHTLRSTTLERLEAFANAGGRLVFLGPTPTLENARPSKRPQALYERSQKGDFSTTSILDAVEPSRMVNILGADGARTENLTCQLRQDGEDRWLFIAHCLMPNEQDVPVKQQIHICVEGQYYPQVYDTLSGKKQILPCRHADGKTYIDTALYDLDSLLIRLSKEVLKPNEATNSHQKETVLTVPALVNVTLSEPNVLLLDKAEYALDDEPYAPAEELLRADNVLRKRFGWKTRQASVVQPWVIGPQSPTHKVRLRFTIDCAQALANIKLALEDAEETEIILNGKPVANTPAGWYVDKSIQTVALPQLHAGENILELVQPFGQRTNVEWCYLLGDFDVQIRGEHRRLHESCRQLGFDDVTLQGLPHYGGNITYEIPITTHGGDVNVTVPHYSGAALKAELDGKMSYIVYPPYSATLTDIKPGQHTLKLTLLGYRHNSFGPVHLADPKEKYLGPDSWRTQGNRWTYSYRLKPLGIRSSPVITETE